MAHQRRRERLLVVTHFYEPEPNFVTADIAARLADDFEVTVLAPHPSYPRNWFYPGARAWWRAVRSSERGVTVWRLPVFPYHGHSHVLRALHYLSFAVPAALLAPLLARGPRVVWVYLGPFFAALAALPFRLAGRARIVFTCADLWPESLLAAGVAEPGLETRALYAYSRAINRMADAIICSTQGTLRRIAGDGVPLDRLHHVPVWTEGDWMLAPDAVSVPPIHPPRIVYAGNLGPAQRLDTVVLAAAELEREGAGVVFDLYGTGEAEASLRRLAAERGLQSVRFHGRVSAAEAFEASASALGQVICLEPSPLFAMSVPSKLSFCCAAGAPLLFGLVGEAADLAAATGGGFRFDASDPSSLALAVKRLLACPPGARAEMSAALRRFHRRHFDPRVLLERCRAIIVEPASAVR